MVIHIEYTYIVLLTKLTCYWLNWVVLTLFCLPWTAITVYCSPSTAPIVANANSPTPYTTVYSTTSYTCDLGFQSTGPTAPFMTCNPSGVTSGIWTLTYSCTCMSQSLIGVVCCVFISPICSCHCLLQLDHCANHCERNLRHSNYNCLWYHVYRLQPRVPEQRSCEPVLHLSAFIHNKWSLVKYVNLHMHKYRG